MPRRGASGEVVAAFLEQHYVEQPVPPTIIVPDADDPRRWRSAVEQAGAGRDRRQSRRRAARVARRWRGKNATLAHRASGSRRRRRRRTGSPALQEALGLPERRAAHRVLRHQPHDGRGDGRVVRGLRPAARCRRPSTAASTSRASRRATTTRRCARRWRGAARASSPASGRVPDLLLIDGGKGQVASRPSGAGRAGPARRAADRRRQGARAQGRAGGDRVPEAEATPLQLPPDHPGLHLMQQIRDEAHRFAIRAIARGAARRAPPRRCRRSPASARKRRQALLAHFGGLKRRAGGERSTTSRACQGISRRARRAHLRAPARVCTRADAVQRPQPAHLLRIILIPLFVGVFYLPDAWLSYENKNSTACASSSSPRSPTGSTATSRAR